jgi:hypothetical protein
MRTRLVALCLLVAGCTSLDRPVVRPTHDDRWREASVAYERDLAQRRSAEQHHSGPAMAPVKAGN